MNTPKKFKNTKTKHLLTACIALSLVFLLFITYAFPTQAQVKMVALEQTQSLPRLIDININDMILSYFFKDTGFNYSGKASDNFFTVTVGYYWGETIEDLPSSGETYSYFEFYENGDIKSRILESPYYELQLTKLAKTNELYYYTRSYNEDNYYKIVSNTENAEDIEIFFFTYINNISSIENFLTNVEIISMSDTELVVENEDYTALIEKYEFFDEQHIQVYVDYKKFDYITPGWQRLVFFDYTLQPDKTLSPDIKTITTYNKINFEDRECQYSFLRCNSAMFPYFTEILETSE